MLRSRKQRNYISFTTLILPLQIALLTLFLCTVFTSTALAATITPQYDTKPEYQKYWTPNFKAQVSDACNFLGGYIGNNITVTLTVTIGSASELKAAFADGAPNSALESTTTKYIASTGTIRFNPSSFDDTAKDWKGNNISLMVHEIFHCLGFNSGITAFAANIDQNNAFKGANTQRVNGNAPYPLNGASDKSHFKRELTPPVANQVVTDKVGVAPRMMAGGGGTLSIVDLAVLADIGYDIPVVNSATTATCLGFKLSPLNSGKYNQLQYKATTYVAGGCGNDEINGNNSAESIILRGEGGNDTLISGNNPTVMIGDDLDELANGKDGSDLYKIETNKAHVIVGLGAKDKIQISSTLVDQNQVNSLTVAAPDQTLPTYYFGGKSFFPLKVTIGSLTLYSYHVQEPLDTVKQKLINSISLSGGSSSCRWDEAEYNWKGTWIRRGNTNTYDATWTLAGQNNVTAVLTITRNGNAISINRTGSSDGTNCQYTGTVAADGKTITGTFTCTNNSGYVANWMATINAGCN